MTPMTFNHNSTNGNVGSLSPMVFLNRMPSARRPS